MTYEEVRRRFKLAKRLYEMTSGTSTADAGDGTTAAGKDPPRAGPWPRRDRRLNQRDKEYNRLNNRQPHEAVDYGPNNHYCFLMGKYEEMLYTYAAFPSKYISPPK